MTTSSVVPAVRTPSQIYQRALRIVVVSVACAAAAMLRYPGGTTLDPSTRNYSLSHNFLSDLGMTVAYNGEANTDGAALFVLSLLLLVVGLGSAVVSIVRYLAADAEGRRWAQLAGMAALLACVAFTGVALTPENRAMALHMTFTEWGWRIVPMVSLFLALASWKQAALHRRAVPAWFVATLALSGYAALLEWGPRIGQPNGLPVQVVAQKLATTILIAALLIAARDIDHARRECART